MFNDVQVCPVLIVFGFGLLSYGTLLRNDACPFRCRLLFQGGKRLASPEALVFLIGVINAFLVSLFLGDEVLFILRRDARVYDSCLE